MVDLDKLVDELSKLTVLEAAELSKKLEETWGVTAVAAAAAPAAAVGGEAAAGGEQTEFSVVLVDAGASKMNVVKEVKAITGLGLKEANELVKGVPKPVKEGIKKEEAEEIKKKLEEAGAKVELK